MRAENATGTADSATLFVQTPPVAPSSPEQFRALSTSDEQVRLEWMPADRAREHRVFQATDGGEFVEIATLPADASTFLVESIPPTARSEFQVRAINRTGSAGTFGLEGMFGAAGSVDTVLIDAADEVIDAAQFGNMLFPDLPVHRDSRRANGAAFVEC